MILGILGSAGRESTTRLGLTALHRRLRAAGVEFSLLDLATDYRELHDLDQYEQPSADSQTARLRERVAAASGVILATPVYHGSYSSLLKNALDHLRGDAFAGRPVGVLANGGGPRGAGIVCDQLRTVIRALGGWSTPTHISTTEGDYLGGEPSAVVGARMDALVDELLLFADRTSRPLASADR